MGLVFLGRALVRIEDSSGKWEEKDLQSGPEIRNFICETCLVKLFYLVAQGMLYLIGLGLADEQDITIRGFNAIKKCSRVYLESYTSILHISQERLEEFYEKKIILADREMVESQADEILRNAENEDIAFLVVGDPFG